MTEDEDWDALRPLAKRINAELTGCSAVVMQPVRPAGKICVWMVRGTSQTFIRSWEEAQAFAGAPVQASLFDGQALGRDGGSHE